ncbi:protein kinase domain-containing protein [Gordonia sp. NPDC003425]
MLEPGSYVAGYRIERELGSGGMGAVFLARHPELPRSDALKILTSDRAVREQFARRFLREAEVAATLDHPAIVTVYNRGRDRVRIGDDVDDVLWIAMQYVPGTDCARELAEVPDGGGLDPRRVTHIVSEVAKALDHAHRRGLLHRDIEPANILLARDSDDAADVGERVLLTDFGVAKATDEVDPLTRAGTVLATLSYASPEQLQGGPLDGRTDQYSLAATAFHLFTGHVPFDDTVTSDVIRAHLNDPVPRVSIEVATVTQVVDAVIAKAMSKQAPDRFANCREFADALAMAVRGMSGPTAVNPRFVRDRPGSGAEVTAARSRPVRAERSHRARRATRPVSRTAAAVLGTRSGRGAGPTCLGADGDLRSAAHRADTGERVVECGPDRPADRTGGRRGDHRGADPRGTVDPTPAGACEARCVRGAWCGGRDTSDPMDNSCPALPRGRCRCGHLH